MATAFAMTATERNIEFGAEAKQGLPKGKKLIVYCGLGGTLKVSPRLASPYSYRDFSTPSDPVTSSLKMT